MLSPESAYFRTQTRPWETFELCLTSEVVSPLAPTIGFLCQDSWPQDLQYL